MKAIVLSSGGVDSTTCISLAIEKYGKENVCTVSIFYGQKHKKELECARKIAAYYGVNHYEFNLSEIMKYSNCSLLLKSTQDIPHKSYAEQIKEAEENKNQGQRVSTYVPFRNGLILSTVASFASGLYENEDVEIFIGAHADDSAGDAYADCRPDFIENMKKAINIGTYGKVHIVAPFVSKNKAGVVKTGLGLKTPYHLTWSCYEGKEKACGKCGTCIDRLEAFKLNNAKDPIDYE